ncbi:MAG: hypothetical protein HFE76_06015 [Firmicutes bacterium]|nr:hypothetical protein [Bacillota bacterium]
MGSDEEYRESEIAKYTVRDTVFSSLFQEKKYLLQLYRALHPEDTETTEADLTNITIQNVLTDGIYNDLGFIVKDRLMILVEAQSTWTMNIIVRAFLYLAQSYHDYFGSERSSLYRSKKVHLPKPELYVIFTGERADKPETISLGKEFFGGEECTLEVRVNMIYGDEAWKKVQSGEAGPQDIISQYIIFTKVYAQQMKKHGRTRTAIAETIRICKDWNVLKEYLESREKEVVDIMMALFDKEYIMKVYMEDVAREAAEKAAKEAAEKAAEKATKEATKKAAKEAAEKDRQTAESLLRLGKLSVEDIAASIPDLSIGDVRQIQEHLQRTL